ncbi:MAG TPA: hypothetical protein VLH15_10870 [Dehalococcoidales bacterium]|nr:hypothetical protein [Dehalococcoidales bacterium]
MREINLIITSSLKNNLRNNVVIIVALATILICAIGMVAAIGILAIAPEVKREIINLHNLKSMLCLSVYGSCLVGLGINMNVFAFQTMTHEKSRGNITALLATPLEVSHIWSGKSLAVFLPGLVMGVVLGLISLLAINYIYFVPVTGFLFNAWIAVSGFLALPLVYLSLSFLVHNIGLTGKPATGNIIVQIFLPFFATLMINLGMRGVLDAASWPFALVNLGVAAAIGIIAFWLKPRLTRERIVLSG